MGRRFVVQLMSDLKRVIPIDYNVEHLFCLWIYSFLRIDISWSSKDSHLSIACKLYLWDQGQFLEIT